MLIREWYYSAKKHSVTTFQCCVGLHSFVQEDICVVNLGSLYFSVYNPVLVNMYKEFISITRQHLSKEASGVVCSHTTVKYVEYSMYL
ncbi:hypothetical protein LSH36_2017g00000 [Paralvinella palmiformis]|uniref:Uncharacterized protein n=1 Tax=Paralvinella palmiformis TaxID=53620 RepID=A0AAD9IQH1_9ANNE|nr:hypothetical protein LSH36_2017g00000 [Paralvinella palmiformis]